MRLYWWHRVPVKTDFPATVFPHAKDPPSQGIREQRESWVSPHSKHLFPPLCVNWTIGTHRLRLICTHIYILSSLHALLYSNKIVPCQGSGGYFSQGIWVPKAEATHTSFRTNRVWKQNLKCSCGILEPVYLAVSRTVPPCRWKAFYHCPDWSGFVW